MTTDNQDPKQDKAPHLAPYRWKPGQSGNLGRPKALTLSEAYRRELSKPDPNDPQGRTYAETLAERMIAKAASGDVAAIKEVADRVEGKARATVSISMDHRESLERAVERLIDEEAAEGRTLTRFEAIAALQLFMPWSHN
jgi:hypothetical protein